MTVGPYCQGFDSEEKPSDFGPFMGAGTFGKTMALSFYECNP